MNTRDSIARAAAGRLMARISGGVLEVVDPWGRATYGRAETDPLRRPIRARVDVHDPRFYERILRSGSAGLGESYADGWWDAEDLTGFLRLAHRSLVRTHDVRDRLHHAARPVIDACARLRPADKERDARNVRAHYDLGDELFLRLLDETMMYSSAVFDAPGESLAAASVNKLDRLGRILELERGDRVLEIGTGWGGFAVHAARRSGCRVTTTTTSTLQYEFARRRVHEAGLDDRVTVRADDYRDIRGEFDKVIAIEMIEAVDWREYDSFFAHCRQLLSDTGIMALQAIVLPDRSFDRAKHRTDFIKRAIFPGGCLPSVHALTSSANAAGLSCVHLDDIGLHYAETLRHWRTNLLARRRELETLGFDERFNRLWNFYFCYCEAGFDERYISTTQVAFAAPGWKPRPLQIGTRSVRHLSTV